MADMVDNERNTAESASRIRRDRCLRSFWRHKHMSMKMTVATVQTFVLRRSDLFPSRGLGPTASDVTQALVNANTTLALVNAYVTPSMCMPEVATQSG